jgi:Ca2+:H+ antiporter
LLIPFIVSGRGNAVGLPFNQSLSEAFAILLVVAYGLGLLFSLKTHRELFAGPAEETEATWV